MPRTAATASYVRRLFGIAAFFNFAAAGALLFLRPVIGPRVGLAPIAGTNLVFVYMTAFLIATFGWAYARVAQDPRRFRPFIELGAIGKLLAVAATTGPWLAGEIGWQLPFVVGGDLVFALLFIDFLRRTRPA